MRMLIFTGASYVGDLLQVNDTLQELWIGGNNIGDDGIAAIAGALCKCRIRELCVRECGITVTGAKALATGLSINQSITVLDVWNNLITEEGARQITQSAVNNGVCEKVYGIDSEYCKNEEVEKNREELCKRRKVGNDICNLV